VICAQIFLSQRLLSFINFHHNTNYGKLMQKKKKSAENNP
jgi:hypothetical protein